VGEYVDVNGVKTWYDTAGSGDPLVLLHGGLVTNDTWGATIPALAESFAVFAPERRGHGHTPDVEGPLNYADMAVDTIGFLEQVVKGPAHLVGWSDGGIIALLVAIERPDLVRRIVPVSANMTPDGVVPEAHDALSADPDDPALAMFRALHAAHSPDGPDHWPVFFAKFTEMASTQPDITKEQLATITAPTLVVSGDDDMIALEHTLDIYRAIPGSELAIIPGTSHALFMEKPDAVNRVVLDFLLNEPAPTLMPFRRASESAG
jgi:pimeloyl-ACP methyl ester carboxylesterase